MTVSVTTAFTCLAWLLGLAAAVPAFAATFTVDTVIDAVDANPGDGTCEVTPGGDCSLRAAIMESNALPGPDTIEIPAGTFVLTLDGADDDAAVGDLDINESDLTIIGAGAGVTVLDAGAIDRLFDQSVSDVLISDLTIQNGQTDFGSPLGGAIQLKSGLIGPNALTLIRVHLLDNRAEAGGALRLTTETVVRIEDSLFQGNETIAHGVTNRQGAAIYCVGCRLAISGSTFEANGDDLSGKVMTVETDATFEMINSTVSANVSGGVRIQNADALIKFCTFVDNGVQNLSFFSFDDTDVFEVGSSVLQSDSSDNCQSGDSPVSLGYNVVGDTSCGFEASGDLEETDALLGPLSDNGGLTRTHLPGAGSAVLDRVSLAACTDLEDSPLIVDQRGSVRPAGSACDAGAVEEDAPRDPLIFMDGFETDL